MYICKSKAYGYLTLTEEEWMALASSLLCIQPLQSSGLRRGFIRHHNIHTAKQIKYTVTNYLFNGKTYMRLIFKA
jgi:hypothetical protein